MSIPFIAFDGRHFKVTTQAREFFEGLDDTQQLGVVSIIGKSRTGKSFFLNNVLLGDGEGEVQAETVREVQFEVSHTTNPCTRGIWISKQLLDPSNKQFKVLVMDVEGLGGIDQNSISDNRVILLPLILSSYLIYNSVGHITEEAIRSLGIVVGFARQLQEKDSECWSLPFFHWIIRDFTLELMDNCGYPITESQYLENSLEEQKGLTETIENKNKVRRRFKQFFKQRTCSTLIRPYNENPLEIREEFQQQSGHVKAKILSTIEPKQIKGVKLTPMLFLQLVETLLVDVNSGSGLNLENSWRSVYFAHERELLGRLEYKLYDEVQHMREEELPKAYNWVRLRFQSLFEQESFSSDAPVGEIRKEMDRILECIKAQLDNKVVEMEQRRVNSGLEVFYQELRDTKRSLGSMAQADECISGIVCQDLVAGLTPRKAEEVRQKVRTVIREQLCCQLESKNNHLLEENKALLEKSEGEATYNCQLQEDLKELSSTVLYLRRELQQNIKEKDILIRNLEQDMVTKKTKLLKQTEELCVLNQKLHLIANSHEYVKTLQRLEEVESTLKALETEYSKLSSEQIRLRSLNYSVEKENTQLQDTVAKLRKEAESREAEILTTEQRIVEQVEREEERIEEILRQAETKAKEKESNILKLERIIKEMKGKPRRVEEICEINSLRSELEEQRTRSQKLKREMEEMRRIYEERIICMAGKSPGLIASKSAIMNLQLTPKGFKVKSFKSPGKGKGWSKQKVCMETKMALQQQLNKESKVLINNLLEKEKSYIHEISALKEQSYLDSEFSSTTSANNVNNSFNGIFVSVPSFTIRSLKDGHTVTQFKVEFHTGPDLQWWISIRYKDITMLLNYLAKKYPEVPEFKLPKTNKAEEKKNIIEKVLRQCLLVHQFRKDPHFKDFINGKPACDLGSSPSHQDIGKPSSPKLQLGRVLSKENLNLKSGHKNTHFSMYVDS